MIIQDNQLVNFLSSAALNQLRFSLDADARPITPGFSYDIELLAFDDIIHSESILATTGCIDIYGLGDIIATANPNTPVIDTEIRIDGKSIFRGYIMRSRILFGPPTTPFDTDTEFLTSTEITICQPEAEINLSLVSITEPETPDTQLTYHKSSADWGAVYHITAPGAPGAYFFRVGQRAHTIIVADICPAHEIRYDGPFGAEELLTLRAASKHSTERTTQTAMVNAEPVGYDINIEHKIEIEAEGLLPSQTRQAQFLPYATNLRIDNRPCILTECKIENIKNSEDNGKLKFSAIPYTTAHTPVSYGRIHQPQFQPPFT